MVEIDKKADPSSKVFLATLNSRFGHFLEQKMNCIPHFWAKNANKMVLIPHLGQMVHILSK